MPFALNQNCRIEYSVEGQGQGMVLLHGIGQTAESTWPKVIRHFKPNRRVVGLNYSGSGRTEDKEAKLSLSFLAGQIIAVADEVGLDDFELVGHSLGAAVALHLAANYPRRVKKLIVLAGFLSTKDARTQLQFRMWREMAEFNPQLLAATMVYNAFSPEFLSGISDQKLRNMVDFIFKTTSWPGALRQIDLALHLDLTREAASISVPTQVVACRHDYLVPPANSKFLAEKIAGAQYAELEAGHAACVENLSQFLKTAENFLDPK